MDSLFIAITDTLYPLKLAMAVTLHLFFSLLCYYYGLSLYHCLNRIIKHYRVIKWHEKSCATVENSIISHYVMLQHNM